MKNNFGNVIDKDMKTFIITWTAFNVLDVQIGQGKTKVKNSLNDCIAKIKLEKYLKKKFPLMNYVIIGICVEDDGFDLNDFFSLFNIKK